MQKPFAFRCFDNAINFSSSHIDHLMIIVTNNVTIVLLLDVDKNNDYSY